MKVSWAIIAAALMWSATPAFAHRLDEYLQATLVSITPSRVQLQINLTPGVDVAEQVLSRIDTDHNGAISTNEAAAYAESLRRDLIVKMDERSLALKLTASNFCAPAELRTGWGMIQMEFTAAPGPLSTGAHRLTIHNRHFPGISVYLLNATQPEFFIAASSKSHSIEITAQKRNQNQSAGEIAFTFRPPPRSLSHVRIIASVAGLLIVLFAGIALAKLKSPHPARAL